MGNGCSTTTEPNAVVNPRARGFADARMRSHVELPDDGSREFTVTSFSGDGRSRSTGITKSGGPDSPSGRRDSIGSRGRRMSLSRKNSRAASKGAIRARGSIRHRSGEEVRKQAEDFEQYGNEVEVKISDEEERTFRKEKRLYTTLFGDLESRDLLFEWNDRVELGITFVDKQHFKLVELVNELHHAEKTDSQRWIVGYVLEKLIRYTDYHFKAEEEIMDKFMYEEDAASVHKRKHKDFVSKVVEFRDKFLNMRELDLGMVILEFLKNWLANHILHTDVKMCKFFVEKLSEEGARP